MVFKPVCTAHGRVVYGIQCLDVCAPGGDDGFLLCKVEFYSFSTCQAT